jgi:hypothetical protein
VGNPVDEARKATTGALTADSRGLVVAPPVNPGLGEDGRIDEIRKNARY